MAKYQKFLKNKQESQLPLNILVIQMAFYGDVILTIPNIVSLYEYYKEICSIPPNIYVMVSKGKEEIFKNTNIIKQTIVFDKRGEHKGLKGAFKIINLLNKLNLDIIFSFHRYTRTNFVVSFAKSKFKAGYTCYPFSFFYDASVKYKFDGTHEVYRNHKVIQKLDSRIDKFLPKKETKYSIWNFDFNKIKEKFKLPSKYIVLAPGTERFVKAWPTDYYNKLAELIINKLDIPVVILGAPKDKDKYCNKILPNPKIYNLCGKTSFYELIEIINFALAGVFNDSAPMHVASILNTPLITIFGPSIQKFGFTPFTQNGILLENNSLKCRPCKIKKDNPCPIGHPCMRAITPETIFKKIKNFVNNL